MSERRPALAGRTAVITGASKGLGLAIAKMMIDEGANVVVTARHAEVLADAVGALGPNARGVPGSVDDEAHAQAVVELAVQEFGAVDVLVNNAAFIPALSPMADLSPRHFDRAMSINVTGPLIFSQAAWRGSMKAAGGVILNIGSTGGLRATPLAGAYCVSKAALFHLTRQLAVELAPSVRVNALAAAVIRGGMNEGRDPANEEREAETYPLQRLGEVADVVAAARYFVSDDSAWVTGQVHTLDGGAMVAPRRGASLGPGKHS